MEMCFLSSRQIKRWVRYGGSARTMLDEGGVYMHPPTIFTPPESACTDCDTTETLASGNSGKQQLICFNAET